jgi:hypothetical protein
MPSKTWDKKIMWSVITVDVSLMKKLLKNISLGAKTSKK